MPGFNWRSALAVAAALLGMTARPAFPDDFYRGKTLSLYAGQPPGGGIDIEMRLVAAHLGRFIPGEPTVQPRNMPGAGGIVLGNHLYSAVAPDGLTLAMPGRAGFVLASITDEKSTRYDVRNFTWIGSAEGANFIFWMRDFVGIRDLAQLRATRREIVVAASGSTTANGIVPEILARYGGPSFRVVRGYPGIADAVLAVERGEADAIYCDRASLHPNMIDTGAVLPVFQTFAVQPGLPTIDALIDNAREGQLIKLLTTPMRLGLPVVGPPGIEADRAAQLREAYVRMASSPEYREQMRARNLDLGAINRGDDLGRQVRDLFAMTPDAVIAEYRAFATGK